MSRRDSGLMQNAGESSEAIVSRIYEEELSKLAQQAKHSGNAAEYQLYQVNYLCHLNCLYCPSEIFYVFSLSMSD